MIGIRAAMVLVFAFFVVLILSGCSGGAENAQLPSTNPERKTEAQQVAGVSQDELDEIDEELFESYNERYTSGGASAEGIIDTFREIFEDAQSRTNSLRQDIKYAEEDLAKVEQGVAELGGRKLTMDSPECSTSLFPSYSYAPDPLFVNLNPTLDEYIEYSNEAEIVINGAIKEARELPKEVQNSLERLDPAISNRNDLIESRDTAMKAVNTYETTYDEYIPKLTPLTERTDALIDEAGCNDF